MTISHSEDIQTAPATLGTYPLEHIHKLSVPRSRCVGQGSHVMVATAHPMATGAALRLLQSGGNAVDAAVAAAWALAVCEPSGSGIGGQTTLLISFPDGRRVVVDGHSYAPAAVSPKTVKRSGQKVGYRATTIPSTPATLGLAGKQFGKLPLAQVLDPAIALAQDGFAVSKLFRRQIQWCRELLQKNEAAAAILLPNGKVPRTKELFVQPAMADTLRRIAKAGTDDFYRGELAAAIVEDMQQQGGLIDASDLAGMHLPTVRESIATVIAGREVVSVPPPGGGLQLLQTLKVLEQLEPTRLDLYGWFATIARVVQVVYRDRLSWPFKPEEMSASMHKWLVGADRAAELAALVRSEQQLAVGTDDEEEGDTTHLCVADQDGMVVSLTQSIQSLYGAKVACRKLGFFYNNYLLTVPRDGTHIKLEGNVAPRSNAAPCLVFDSAAANPTIPILAIGAAGSRRITSSILQVIANRFWLGMPLPEAVDAPRIHGTLGGSAYVEKRIATPDMMSRLAKSFGQVEVKASRSYSMGGVQALAREGAEWVGSADPRREGTAGGY